MFFIICCLVVVLSLFFVYFFPQYYICELVISFLPYIVFFSLSVACVLIILFLKWQSKFRKIYLFLAFFYIVSFLLYSLKFNTFYNGEWFKNIDHESTWLNILYSNILYKTKNYDELQQRIFSYDADVVLMVEFTQDFDEAMWDALKQVYPYTAHMSFADKYYWNVIFSKYPVKNLSSEIAVENSRWRYSYFMVNNWNENYYIYLVHTAAPVSKYYFVMRNNQLEELIDDFLSHWVYRDENERVLVIGDFNLSPWSIYYKKLEKSLDSLYDLTKNFSVATTWAYNWIWLIASHIDHVFVDNKSKIDNLQLISTPWSDHRWFFIKNFR